jgi:membrane protein DedA with SNARE-associated domain
MPEILTRLFARYGYSVIFVGVLLENAGVPAPGHTVVLGGAFLAQTGKMSLPKVFALACAAAILGDNIGYWIGRKGGRPFVKRHHRFLRLTDARQQSIEVFFHQHGAKTVFLARFVTGLQTVGALFAGMSGMSWNRFLIFNVAGAFVWSAVYCTVGFLFGASWQLLNRWVGLAGVLALVLVVVLGLLLLLGRYRVALRRWLKERLPTGYPLWIKPVMTSSLGVSRVLAKISDLWRLRRDVRRR